jgi:hypothetical protein
MPNRTRCSLNSRKSLLKFLIPLLIIVFIWRFLPRADVFPIYSNEDTSLPPLYPYLQDREGRLPQHNLDLPYPEGRSGMCHTFVLTQCINDVVFSEDVAFWQSNVGGELEFTPSDSLQS